MCAIPLPDQSRDGCGAGTYGVVSDVCGLGPRSVSGGGAPKPFHPTGERGAPADRMLTESLQVIPTRGLPGALGHARQLATVSHLTKAHAAQAELAVNGVRTAAALAAGVRAHTELRLASSLGNQS